MILFISYHDILQHIKLIWSRATFHVPLLYLISLIPQILSAGQITTFPATSQYVIIMWTSKQGSLCILYLRNRKIINSFKRSLRNFDHYFILPRKILERQLIMHQNMKILFITVFKKYGFQNNVWKSVHFLSDQLHQSTILNWFCVQSERSKGKRSMYFVYTYTVTKW